MFLIVIFSPHEYTTSFTPSLLCKLALGSPSGGRLGQVCGCGDARKVGLISSQPGHASSCGKCYQPVVKVSGLWTTSTHCRSGLGITCVLLGHTNKKSTCPLVPDLYSGSLCCKQPVLRGVAAIIIQSWKC